MKSIWEKWKLKWEIETDKRMGWIFLIFAITGSSTLFVRKELYDLLEINIASPVLSLLVRIGFVYVIYQFLLFAVGSLMGEHKFVKWFLLKMNIRIFPFLKKWQ